MQTLQLQLDDDIYDTLKAKSVDIPTRINEYLRKLADDGYPAISTEEAKQRVSNAVDRYKGGTGHYINHDEYSQHKNSIISNLESKYAHN